MKSVLACQGLTFSVEIARQGGKNELSSRLELLLITLYAEAGGSIVKCSPTFKPQTLISIERLEQMLSRFGFEGIYRRKEGYIIQFGNAEVIFLSAEEKSSVVGHTASLLLEVDEAQDVDKDKFSKDFAPMASSTAATRVFYGTTWDDFSLLEQIKQQNLEDERRDGIKRHFAYDWRVVAQCNEAYGQFVESERQRLGEDHPLFRTQYRLLTIAGGGRLFSSTQIALVKGEHGRAIQPASASAVYLAGLDLAGQGRQEDDLTRKSSRRDAAVLTIAEFIPPTDKLLKLPSLRVVQFYAWTGQPYVTLYQQLVELLKKWHVHQLIVDATGMGEPVAAFLRQALGSRVESFVFTQQSKSKLGFNFISFVNSGRLKLFQGDGSQDYQLCIRELELARVVYRPNQSMNFFVEPSEGHDDYLMSLALCCFAASDWQPREAKGGIRDKA